MALIPAPYTTRPIPLSPLPETDPIPYRPGEWFRQHHVVVRHHGHHIGANGLALYNVIASHANLRGQCWVTIPTMQYETAMGRNRVRRTLRHLEAYGLIALVWRTFTLRGKTWRGYLITLLDPNPVAVSLRQASRGHAPACISLPEDRMGVQNEQAWGCTVDPEAHSPEADEEEDLDAVLLPKDTVPEPEAAAASPPSLADSPVIPATDPEPDPEPPAERAPAASASAPAPDTEGATTPDTAAAGKSAGDADRATTALPRSQQACPHPHALHSYVTGGPDNVTAVICGRCLMLLDLCDGAMPGTDLSPPPSHGAAGRTHPVPLARGGEECATHRRWFTTQ